MSQIMKKRVFMCGFVQESNSFNPVLTNMEDFESFDAYWGNASIPEKFCIPSACGAYEILYKADV